MAMTSPQLDRQEGSRGSGRWARTLPARSPHTARINDIPRWGWWQLALLCLLLSPYPVMMLVNGEWWTRMAAAGRFSLVMTGMILMAAATLLAFDWRIGRSPGSGHLAAALVFVTLQELPMMLLASYDAAFVGHVYELSPVHALSALVALALFARVGGRGGPPRVDPMVTGALLGAAVAISHVLLVVSGRDHLLTPWSALGVTLIAVVCAALALTVLCLARGTLLPTWAARRLIAVLLLYAVARLAPGIVQAGSPRWWSVLLVVAAGVTMLGVAGRVLRQTMVEHDRLTASYAHLAETARADLERDREVGHEMTSIVAGIVAASSLLTCREDDEPSTDPKQLQDMIAAETARLHRISSDRAEEPVCPIPIDHVLAPLVVAQSSLGHPVTWRPSGHLVLGRRDALAEVLNILLTNAARHAGGMTTTVTVGEVGSRVEIRVADQGPGIAPDLAASLFEWGVRNPGSVGQGIGLQLARRLMHAAGGTVYLERNRHGEGATGATFVVSLPTARSEDHQGSRELTMGVA